MKRSDFNLVYFIIGLFFVVPLLTGCKGRGVRATSYAPAVLPYKVDGASDPARTKWRKQLNSKGAQVVSVGQNYLIRIPTQRLFSEQSPQLTWASYSLLNDVVSYLQQFRKVAVRVVTYAESCASPQRERALARAQSRAVSDYLWSQGIDSRFIFSEGEAGQLSPEERACKTKSLPGEARIEILFRDAVV